MRDVAKIFGLGELSKNVFSLYENFRPTIPKGVTGWGTKGIVDTDRI
jgi:hypothetical protein